MRKSETERRSMRIPVAPRPSAEERASAAMLTLCETGHVQIQGGGASFSRVFQLLEQGFAREREAFRAASVDHVHRYTLQRNIYLDAWTITRELIPPATPACRDAYRARVDERVAQIIGELRSFARAGFGDTRERSPVDGQWFDAETLDALAAEAAIQGLRYRLTPCPGLAFSWIERLTD